MSEEQNQVQETEKNCKCKVLVILTIISFVFSIAALAISAYTLATATNGGSAQAGAEQPKVVISKQYDRGRSMAKALQTRKPIIAFFYTDWCGFCQKFAPTFDKVTKNSKVKKHFAIAFVNCEQEENRKIMQEYAVEGFPTVYVIDANGKRTHLDNGTFFKPDSKEVIVKNVLKLINVE